MEVRRSRMALVTRPSSTGSPTPALETGMPRGWPASPITPEETLSVGHCLRVVMREEVRATAATRYADLTVLEAGPRTGRAAHHDAPNPDNSWPAAGTAHDLARTNFGDDLREVANTLRRL